MSLVFLSSQQIHALEALAQFQYLTTAQLMDCRVSKSLPVIRNKVLYYLVETHRPFAKYRDFGTLPGKGRLSRIYYLTKRGAEAVALYLEEDLTHILYPKGGVQFTSDYFHRVSFVDVHIACRKWAELQGNEVDFFTAYFDKLGSNRSRDSPLTSKNKVMLNHKIFIPDGITRVSIHGKEQLFLIEVHKGNNTKRITEQLNRHIDAMAQGVFTQRYDHPRASFVLSIYEKQGILESVRQRMLEIADFKAFEGVFLFNTLEQIKQDFAQGWIHANGQGFEHLKPKG